MDKQLLWIPLALTLDLPIGRSQIEKARLQLPPRSIRQNQRRLDKQAVSAAAETAVFHEGAEQDRHFAEPVRFDRITRPDEPWFEHLKQFVDWGADLFKQDGAFQVCSHPDRLFGNGMTDAEMHNLYVLCYSRQMWEGFADHTNRRPVVFTPVGWTGFQAWAGTWTGDTGGRLDTLGAMLNTALMGHSWLTNDMEVAEKEGIHFGYLLPWSQINSWSYFRMPWVQGTELSAMHRFYSRFRSKADPVPLLLGETGDADFRTVAAAAHA